DGAPNDQDDHRGGQDSTTGSLHGLLLHDKRPTGGRHSFDSVSPSSSSASRRNARFCSSSAKVGSFIVAPVKGQSLRIGRLPSRPGCRSGSGVPAPFTFFCPPALGVALPLLRLFLLLLLLPGPCREDRPPYRRGHRKQYPELR